jgi:hypothetical protein
MARPQRRFTIYDVMESKGVFEANPANADARDMNGLSAYKKEEYPKMLYHPEGAVKITRPAEAVATPFGPKWVGEQTELLSKIVNNEAEENALLKDGWHKLPSLAIRAGAIKRGENPPEIAIDSVDAMRMDAEDEMTKMRKAAEAQAARIAELEAELAVKQAKPK